jgi:hypothetical protein
MAERHFAALHSGRRADQERTLTSTRSSLPDPTQVGSVFRLVRALDHRGHLEAEASQGPRV